MHRLYLVLKDHKEPPTNDEIAIASGQKGLDPASAADYLLQLEKASTNLVDVFKQQSQQAAVCFLENLLFTQTDCVCHYRMTNGTRKNLRDY